MFQYFHILTFLQTQFTLGAFMTDWLYVPKDYKYNEYEKFFWRQKRYEKSIEV